MGTARTRQVRQQHARKQQDAVVLGPAMVRQPAHALCADMQLTGAAEHAD